MTDTPTNTAQVNPELLSRSVRDFHFPTMVFVFDIAEAAELNETLKTLVYAARDADQEGVQKSNFRALGSWHSQGNLHLQEPFAPLSRRVAHAAQTISDTLGYDPAYRLKIDAMWSIINPPGSFNRAHIHPGALWSGVYYVQTPENAGDIEFTDPRTENIMNQARFAPDQKRKSECWTKANYKPAPGRLLMFPSFLYHSVAPNLSEEPEGASDRIILSFNLSQHPV